jgi:hypothetical protein
MPLALLVTSSTERDSLVKEYVVTDLSRFSYHDTASVIDEETTSDDGGGVNFDSSEEPAELGNQTGHKRHAPLVKPMSKPVGHRGVEARIAKENLQDAPCRWILPKDGCDLLSNRFYHLSRMPGFASPPVTKHQSKRKAISQTFIPQISNVALSLPVSAAQTDFV